MAVFGIRSTVIDGDALNPSDLDLIAQVAQLNVGEPVPEGWRVLTGNVSTSQVARVAYRFEIAAVPQLEQIGRDQNDQPIYVQTN